MQKSYKTINEQGQAEVIEKKSRFIANVLPVFSEQEAIDFINKIKKQYYDARHNCFAYVIGGNIPIMRFSDDGEPSGTAGKPILDVLLGEKLENVVVVVTRYFGGTLLGTGGLVRAYGKSAKEGILAGKIVEMDSYTKVFIYCSYSIRDKIEYEINKNNHIITDIKYSEIVCFHLYIKSNLVDDFEKDITNFRGEVKSFIKFEENEFLKVIDGQVVLD